MNQSLKIVFFGSGPVASATLESLVTSFDVEAVITKPKPPHHRGSVPVLEFAEQHSLKTFTPANKRELTKLLEATKFQSPVGVVVDYGIIIEKPVIDSFSKGIVNSHFSLLPQWRGADPITFSILSGQPETGVSLMVINEKLDEGDLIAQQKLPLPATITTPELTDQLVTLSNEMLKEYLPKYVAGKAKTYPQPNETPSYSRRLTKEDGQLDPANKPASALEREVRAFTGWPKSHINVLGHDIVVTRAHASSTASPSELSVKCADGSLLVIDELVAPSGRKMDGAAFLRGYKK